LPAENLLFASASVPRDDTKQQEAMQNNLQWIRKVIDANGLESAGPVRVITTEFGAESYTFDVAIRYGRRARPAPASPISPKLEGPVQFARSEPGRAAMASFTGHKANLPKIRDSLRAWALTRGYEATGRPFEAWTNGVAEGFSETGEFDVYWTLK
jgi:hypothetical protein